MFLNFRQKILLSSFQAGWLDRFTRERIIDEYFFHQYQVVPHSILYIFYGILNGLGMGWWEYFLKALQKRSGCTVSGWMRPLIRTPAGE